MQSIESFLDLPSSGKRRICLVTSIFHGFGKIGGFGTMAKSLAMVLVQNNYEVIVATPRRKKQEPVTEIAGFTVLGLTMAQLLNPEVYKRIGADLYHSQSPNLMSVAAMLGCRGALHVITCRDPRSLRDWMIEIRDATWRRKIRNVALALFEAGPLVAWSIRRADCVAYAAHFLQSKIERMYRPKVPLTFLPNIESVPAVLPKKADTPTVCFVGRFDRRKRPELFIDLARKFPEVSFLMVGRAEDAKQQLRVEDLARPVRNLRLTGYVDKFDDKEFYDIYATSWILVNSATREAHPLTFFEAAGRGCAIISFVNPDNFASEFGYWAANEDFEQGLRYLLENDNWRAAGEKGYRYVKQHYRYDVAANAHLALYAQLFGKKRHA